MVQITNLSQHGDTLTRHLQEFEKLSEQWSAERRGLEAHLLAEQQATQQHSQQNKQLQGDLDCSLRFQQELQVRMRDEQEAAKEEHKRSQASLFLIRHSEQEEMNQKFVTLMAENEKLVRDKLECFQRESRLEDLREEAQVGLGVEPSEVIASPASPSFCSCCPLLNLAFRCVCVCVCARTCVAWSVRVCGRWRRRAC
jgi:hypothetical protein